MQKYFFVSVVAFSLALPISAQADQRLHRELKVAPGEYTLNEMVQIANSGSRRKQQMAVIANNREALRKRVFDAVHGGTGTASIEVSREARPAP